jgi:6-methylsalicylate decarboxylase
VELIEAHLAGSEALPEEFARWGPIALDGLDPADVDLMLNRGCVGISLPAGALAGRDRLELVGGLLERVAARRVPLFVHPGPALGGRTPCEPLSEPLWWRALTDYVAQMQAAWLTFAAFGRRAHPYLTVIFALLAGCAPLHSERLEARGGPRIDLRDPLTFYETSSYGPSATEALSRRVGERQLLYGSDRPVLEPVNSGRDRALQSSAAALFATMGAVA